MFGYNAFGATALGDSPAPAATGGGTTTVTADFVGSFNVLAFVTRDFAGSFDIQGFGTVAADFVGTFDVQAQVQRDFVGVFDALTTVSRDFAGAFDVRQLVTRDFASTFDILAANKTNFTPSIARTIKPLAGPNRFAGGDFWNLADPTRPIGIKDPDSVIDIPFDWSDVLGDIRDTIANVVFTLDGVTSAGTNAAGTLTTVFVAGKTANEASIAARITTASTPARVFDRTVYLTFKEM